MNEAVRRSIRPAKTGEMIAAYLRGRIVRGELPEGDSLPSELELMQQFDVSRPTLREAFRILEAESLIQTRRGARGARILAPDVEVAARGLGALLQTSGTTLADVYQVIAVLEPVAAGMLATRRTAADLDELTTCVDQLQELLARSRFPDGAEACSAATERFRDVMLARAGNRALEIQSRVLRAVLAAHMSKVVHRSAAEPDVARRYRWVVRCYRELVGHLAARDAEAAQACWRSYLSQTTRTLLAGEPTSATLADELSPSPVLDLFA